MPQSRSTRAWCRTRFLRKCIAVIWSRSCSLLHHLLSHKLLPFFLLRHTDGGNKSHCVRQMFVVACGSQKLLSHRTNRVCSFRCLSVFVACQMPHSDLAGWLRIQAVDGNSAVSTIPYEVLCKENTVPQRRQYATTASRDGFPFVRAWFWSCRRAKPSPIHAWIMTRYTLAVLIPFLLDRFGTNKSAGKSCSWSALSSQYHVEQRAREYGKRPSANLNTALITVAEKSTDS